MQDMDTMIQPDKCVSAIQGYPTITNL